jgi:hypothetical protein
MKFNYCLLIIMIYPTMVFSQNDSLTFNNDDGLVGEIKSMDRGILQIGTDYSDGDIKITWNKIRTIRTETSFFIALTDGRKYFGTVKSVSDSTLHIVTVDYQTVECQLDHIVTLSPIRKTFFDSFSASIDIGFSLTKANNLQQVSSRSSIGYRTRRWTTIAVFNSLRSTQDDADPIQRSTGKITYTNILPLPSLYGIGAISLESNTQQKLDLRLNAQLGIGRYFVHTNYTHWSIILGFNRNIEQFSSATPDRESWEGVLGTELDLYNIGDLNLFTDLIAYQGITATERFRSDFTFDAKYNLPYNLYIKMGFTINYDNRPAEGATELDYVFQTGIGWEW